jgi:DNA repair exonuclease SbcCD nuclease subunit
MAIFMADAHIRLRTWPNWTALRGDAHEALRRIASFKAAYEEEHGGAITCGLAGGDILDSNRPSSEDVLVLRDFMRLFRQWYFVRGNHDKVSPSFQMLADSDEVRVAELFPDSMVRLGGSVLCGVSYCETASGLLEQLRSVPSAGDLPQYVLMHNAFRHLLGHDESWKVTIDEAGEIFSGRQVRILVGDIHTRDTTRMGETGGYIHSPGALYPQSWDAVDSEHAATLLDLGTGDISEIACGVRSYFRIPRSSRLFLLSGWKLPMG